MGMEGAPTPDNTPKPEDESLRMTRRGFLIFAGEAVALGAAKGIGIETQTDVPESEGIPSERELIDTFNILRGEHSCRERRKHADEKGIYLWELEFEIEGGTAEFGYMRKGEYTVGGSAGATKIFITYFDTDGISGGGTDVAEFKKGKWVVDTDFQENIE